MWWKASTLLVLTGRAAAMLPAATLQEVAGAFPVLDWLFDSGGSFVFPLMDFVTSEFDEIDFVVEKVSEKLARPCQADSALKRRTCPALTVLLDTLEELRTSHMPDRLKESAMAEWALQLDWLMLANDLGGPGGKVLQSLEKLSNTRQAQRQDAGYGSQEGTCDSMSTEEDFAFMETIQRSLRGLETLPLEQNEFKWAEFFARRKRGHPFCALGVASLFLVAGDITACAAAIAGGEHLMRVRRAIYFAQGIARYYARSAPLEDQAQRMLDIVRSSWPLWSLLLSIGKDLQERASPSAAPSSPGQLWPVPAAGARAPFQDDTYLTVVVQCRNDDYGGGMLTRLNRMLSTATFLLHAFRIPSEILIVEWNPPLGALPIHMEVQRSPCTEAVPIRVVRVPTSVHMSMPHHKAHPIFEHTAENVAFRRARGKFVLKTNIDNILSPDTVAFFASGHLREDVIYRATYLEYDVTRPETEGMDATQLLTWLFSRPDLLDDMQQKSQELQEKYPEDANVCLEGHPGEPQEDLRRPFYWAGSGDFVLTSRELLLRVRGYPQVAQNWQTDDLIHCRLRAAGVRQVVLQPPCATLHQNHRRINRVRSSTRWVITDANFQDVCKDPFRPLPTETGMGDNWGFADHDFEEHVV